MESRFDKIEELQPATLLRDLGTGVLLLLREIF